MALRALLDTSHLALTLQLVRKQAHVAVPRHAGRDCPGSVFTFRLAPRRRGRLDTPRSQGLRFSLLLLLLLVAALSPRRGLTGAQ